MPTGDVLVQAQKIWKEKKDVGRPIAAIFLADISGSMGGTKIKGVKDAMNGIVYKDDSQVYKINATKIYSEEPRIEYELVTKSNTQKSYTSNSD